MPTTPYRIPEKRELQDLAKRLRPYVKYDKDTRRALDDVLGWERITVFHALARMRRAVGFALDLGDQDVIPPDLRSRLQRFVTEFGRQTRGDKVSQRFEISVTAELRDNLTRAAKKAGYQTVSRYVRERLEAVVADELGLDKEEKE